MGELGAGTKSPCMKGFHEMSPKYEVISGPRFLHRSDQAMDYYCKICSLPPKRTFNELVTHYTGLHEYQVMDYPWGTVRCLEVDEAGRFSERAEKVKRRHLLTTAS